MKKDANSYLQNLSDSDFRELAESFLEFSNTGTMEENAPFRKFHENFNGKDSVNFAISELVFGQEITRRWLNLIKV